METTLTSALIISTSPGVAVGWLQEHAGVSQPCGTAETPTLGGQDVAAGPGEELCFAG